MLVRLTFAIIPKVEIFSGINMRDIILSRLILLSVGTYKNKYVSSLKFYGIHYIRHLFPLHLLFIMPSQAPSHKVTDSLLYACEVFEY